MSRRFMLLDRDGTINVEKHYLSDPDAVELIPNAAAGLRLMRESGFGLIVITNQAAIGRGIIDEARLQAIHVRLVDLLRQEDVTLDGIYYCPHHPDDHCDCRKPLPGLALSAARDHGFDVAESVVIGDKDSDIGVAHALHCRSVLVRSGYGREHEKTGKYQPDHVVDDLLEAARLLRETLVE